MALLSLRAHTDLFFENPVKLPFLNIELPLLAFFFLSPILFIVVHAYTLVHLVMLAEKAKRYHHALHDPERNITEATRANLQWQLPSNIFIQFLAGPFGLRVGLFGWLLRTIAWLTLVIAPVLLLLMMQVQFLPFHSSFITWTQRIALLADLMLMWWLWRKILSGRELDGRSRRAPWAWPVLGLALSAGAVLFCWTAATFPGEWQEDHWPGWPVFPASDKRGRPTRVSLHDWVFSSQIDHTTRRRSLPFSNTLVLTGLNIYEGLKIDDPEKVKWRDYVFRARGRDLKGAMFDLANLPRVDFFGSQLQGASFVFAQLQGASLELAKLQGASFGFSQLQGASLHSAQLQGASFELAKLQGATLGGAQLQGASLFGAQLQGASFELAKLQGATLQNAQLQGASLGGAQLQGASLFGAQLQGASLEDAQLQGASLFGAQLQGASFSKAHFRAVDLSNAFLWRAGGGADVETVRLPDEPNTWRPVFGADFSEIRPWNDKVYQDLCKMMGSLPPGDLRDQARDRIRRLDCANPDQTLASCDASVPLPPQAAAWKKSLEDARVDNAAYAKALAAELKTEVCSGDKWADGLRGLMKHHRLAAAGPEVPPLVDAILSKDCPVSASLTDADKTNLLQIKRDANK